MEHELQWWMIKRADADINQGGTLMLTDKKICRQLSSLYPDFGDCGDSLDINWDENNKAWAVDFEYAGSKIRHYLENKDAAACVINDQCIGLGIEFGQFR